MKKLYVFNPDHDLALANFDPNYMPSANVRQLASDLALLPAWYANEYDLILASSAYNKAFLEVQKESFPTLPSLQPFVLSDSDHSGFYPFPWGWNPSITNKFKQLGIHPDSLPSEERLKKIRQYSHRQLSVALLSKLQLNKGICGTACYLTDIKEIRKFVEGHKKCVLKAPLSGSGKGLNWCKGTFTYHIEHWCKNILKQQDGVVAEPQYPKMVDFAMQFHVNKLGNVVFAGYSSFETTASGAYLGNVLATNEQIEQTLETYIPVSDLKLVKDTLLHALSEILPGVYSGYLGVDMMICRYNMEPFYRIHPCVEINLRMNMGMVCRLLYNCYIHPGSRGMFRIDYYQSVGKLRESIQVLQRQHPLQVMNGRIVKGYLGLVPVTPGGRYHAWVEIY